MTKAVSFSEIGRSGLNRWGGTINQEWLSDLKGIKAIRVYTEMSSNDPVIGALLFAMEMLIKGAEWRVEPSGNSNIDMEAADFLESCLHDMEKPWLDVLSEILTMLIYGWSFHEEVYKRRIGPENNVKSKYNDGRIGWRKLPIRSQESLWEWVFDNNTEELLGMIQQPPPSYRNVSIPMSKALLFRTKSIYDNPEGVSILRTSYVPWYYKKNIQIVEGIGIERDLAGLPIAEVPPSILAITASPDERAIFEQVKKIVTNVRRDENEGIIFPAEKVNGAETGYRFRLLSTGGQRQFDTTAIIQRYDQRIAMSVLGDVILIGHNAVGSFALSSSKSELFSMGINSILKNIEAQFNNVAIPRLFSYNSFPGLTALPRLVSGDIETPDLVELATYIEKLTGSGAALFPDEDLEAYLRRVANLPENRAHTAVVPEKPSEIL